MFVFGWSQPVSGRAALFRLIRQIGADKSEGVRSMGDRTMHVRDSSLRFHPQCPAEVCLQADDKICARSALAVIGQMDIERHAAQCVEG